MPLLRSSLVLWAACLALAAAAPQSLQNLDGLDLARIVGVRDAGGPEADDQKDKPEPVAILKQINE